MRFTRDSHSAKIHHLRDAAEHANIQLLYQNEMMLRQRIENAWLSSFLNAIVPHENEERNELEMREIERMLVEKDVELRRLRKEMEDDKVATTALEHSLRDKLKKALLFAEQSSTATKKLLEQERLQQAASSSFSFVDVNLPVEVRFARAHVIAKKALEMEQRGAEFGRRRDESVGTSEEPEPTVI